MDPRRTIVETDEYYIIPEDVLPLLPEDWQESFAERVADGKAILKSVDGELDGLAKLARSFPSLISMKHAAKRLSQFKFEVDLDRLLDLDMMTTAFVVSYAVSYTHLTLPTIYSV